MYFFYGDRILPSLNLVGIHILVCSSIELRLFSIFSAVSFTLGRIVCSNWTATLSVPEHLFLRLEGTRVVSVSDGSEVSGNSRLEGLCCLTNILSTTLEALYHVYHVWSITVGGAGCVVCSLCCSTPDLLCVDDSGV